MMNDPIYTKKLIAFIDILGFREKIKETEDSMDLRFEILQKLKSIFEFKRENDEESLSLRELGKEVTIFSDSIVISYPLDFGGGLFFILMNIIHIQIDLLFKGIIFRGGLAIGDVYHDGSIVFGPGMVSAYDLESKFAKFPRIILSEQTILEAMKYKSTSNSYEQEREYINDLVKKDIDDFYFVDFLKQYQELDENEYYYIMIKKIKGMIELEMAKPLEASVLKKYKWLKNYYNETVRNMNLSKEYYIVS